ncbi:uncharacterized protein BJX67DRAFT_389109 [Aspergillus lucknowensis]|uniref:RRM domain-containing protein n=1 Tax=Aspergillus lucknowensis TaxID=176173 RepID=A0ABR4M4L6_9EURO
MNPYSPAFVPEFARRRSQSMASPQSINTTKDTVPADSHFHQPTAQVIDTAASTLSDSIRSSNDPAVQYPPTMIANRAYRPRQSEIVSPVTHRVNTTLLQKLNKLDIQDSSDSSNTLTAYRLSADKITTPSEMPIGSLVHLMHPPKYGVVKISNIPYSITKQEIFQFLGRQARLITSDKGCPIHIIMERSTAKTMDCYVELETPNDAKDTINRINRIYETGRAPRLGNRHVEVELTDQNELLRNLFPRAKCVVWRDATPYVLSNEDKYCSGFAGFFTSEEIILAIRHAEIPHRSPFCDKCPQRTYESTISTLYKYPWYAPQLYTVHDRNQLFELANRHIIALVARVKRVNTVGLDQKLLHDLLQAGLKCPAFNERQKYTLCVNSEISSEINKFPEMGKWFPFDCLVKMPNFHEDIHFYYAGLISAGTVPKIENLGLPNTYPTEHPTLRSPYGPIWFEWPQSISSSVTWDAAVNQEMVILSSLVFSGWINDDMGSKLNSRKVSRESSFSLAPGSHRNTSLAPSEAEGNGVNTELSSRTGTHAAPSRRASESASISSGMNLNTTGLWNQKLLLYPGKPRPGYLGHRITQSSPMCLLSPTKNPWGSESAE